MSHDYLLDTYTHIKRRLASARQRLSAAGADQDEKQYATGQIEALSDFERFLVDNFNAKLPRRLRRRFPKST
jgi:hypothetical protein